MTHSVSEKLFAQIIAQYASATVATDFQTDERGISKNYLSLLSKGKYILQDTYVAVVGLAFECAKFKDKGTMGNYVCAVAQT